MSKNLRIEDHEFFIVSATAEVLILLLDYLRVIVNLPMLTTDTMSRIIEFLKAFNSRTCQVVLGAGAMRSAGLKNITAKHLGWLFFFQLWNVTHSPHLCYSIGITESLDHGCAHTIYKRDVQTTS